MSDHGKWSEPETMKFVTSPPGRPVRLEPGMTFQRLAERAIVTSLKAHPKKWALVYYEPYYSEHSTRSRAHSIKTNKRAEWKDGRFDAYVAPHDGGGFDVWACYLGPKKGL